MTLALPPAAEFPFLAREGLVYLDSAATSQTPRPVIDAMDRSRTLAAERMQSVAAGMGLPPVLL